MTITAPIYVAKILWHKEIIQISPNIFMKAQEYSILECNPQNFLGHRKLLCSFSWVTNLYQVRAGYSVVNKYYVTPYIPEHLNQNMKEQIEEISIVQVVSSKKKQAYETVDQGKDTKITFLSYLAIRDNSPSLILSWDTKEGVYKWVCLSALSSSIHFRTFVNVHESLAYIIDEEEYKVYRFDSMNELVSYIHMNIDLSSCLINNSKIPTMQLDTCNRY
jgi:hypothetical protein